MREGWTYKKLGEIGKIITGSTPSTKNAEYYSAKDYCFVKPSDLPSNGFIKLKATEYYLSEAGYNISRQLPKGSVLVSCIGIIGKTAILDVDACCNQQINAIIPNQDVSPSFLAYSILSQRFKLESIANAPVVPIINKGDFSKIKIPLPPKSQQEAIVSELDEINSLLALKRDQLQKYDKLAQSLFYEMFGDPVENEKGWEISSLSYICASITDGSHNPPKGIGKSSYLMLSSKNIKDGALSLEDPRYLTESEYIVENKRTNVQKGDILLTIVGTIGRCCIFDSSDFIVFQRSVAVLKPKNFVNSQYLMHHIIALRDNLENEAKGVAQKGIYLKQLGRIQMLLPPLPLQQQFASRIEQIEEQKQQVQAAIEKLETLLASRMQHWFE